jgi:hypothetical protein
VARDGLHGGGGERSVWLLVLCGTVALALWVQGGIEDLRGASERRESELVRFVELRQRAAAVGVHEAGRAARLIDREFRAQGWHRNLLRTGSVVRPRVVPTETGLVVRLSAARRPDISRGSASRGSAASGPAPATAPATAPANAEASPR